MFLVHGSKTVYTPDRIVNFSDLVKGSLIIALVFPENHTKNNRLRLDKSEQKMT